MLKLKCPLCDMYLHEIYSNRFVCPTIIDSKPHYSQNLELSKFHIIIPPYMIFSSVGIDNVPYSVIAKLSQIYQIYLPILDTRILGIPQILPDSETKLLNKIHLMEFFL